MSRPRAIGFWNRLLCETFGIHKKEFAFGWMEGQGIESGYAGDFFCGRCGLILKAKAAEEGK